MGRFSGFDQQTLPNKAWLNLVEVIETMQSPLYRSYQVCPLTLKTPMIFFGISVAINNA
jgi:hypothetical protein